SPYRGVPRRCRIHTHVGGTAPGSRQTMWPLARNRPGQTPHDPVDRASSRYRSCPLAPGTMHDSPPETSPPGQPRSDTRPEIRPGIAHAPAGLLASLGVRAYRPATRAPRYGTRAEPRSLRVLLPTGARSRLRTPSIEATLALTARCPARCRAAESRRLDL